MVSRDSGRVASISISNGVEKMSLERFRTIILWHEGFLVRQIMNDNRDYAPERYARVRLNIDEDGFILGIGEYEPEDAAYRGGEDAYVWAVQEMEKMCRLGRDPLDRLCRNNVHCIEHLFVYDIFGLARRETGFVSPIVVRGHAYYARERAALYRRFLLGVVKYFVEKDLVRFVPVVVFDRFLKVFGCYENWIPGRMSTPVFSCHSEHVPFLGCVLLSLAGLFCVIEKEMKEDTLDTFTVCCHDPCTIAGSVGRYLFNLPV